MPQADPLNNIMGMLRRSKSIDPGAAQARQSRMATDRRRMGPGASPIAQPNEMPPPQDMMGMINPAMGMQEVAGEGQELAQGQDMTVIMIDQMNEIILSGKIQIHREQDREKRRLLETHLETIRKQILDLGGEPIWADESIEEGLQKLQGFGAVGAPQINEELNNMYGWQGSQGVPMTNQPNALGQTLQNIGVSNAVDNIPRRDSGVGVRSYVEQAGGQVHWNPDDPMAAIIQGPMGQQRVAFTENVGEGGQWTGYAPEQAVREAMLATGVMAPPVPGAPIRVGGQVIEMPTAPNIGDYNSAMDLLEAAGLSRDLLPSLEDWEDFKVGSVRKAAMDRRQVIQRELTRFEENWPNEFEKAKKQVSDWAGEQKAVDEENMAARGMFYSSIMANSITKIDDKAMEVIGEISRDAANKVADLRAQIQDIDELEILEVEIAKREAKMEYFDQRMNLANMLAEVQYQRDLVALNQFQVMSQRYMDMYNAETSRVQAEYDRMLENQQIASLGMWASHDPFMSQYITSSGLGDSFKSMNSYQQAALVESLVNVVLPVKQGEEAHKMQMALMTAQIAAENARTSALSAEKRLAEAEAASKEEVKMLLDKYYRGEATPAEIQRLEKGGHLQSTSIFDIMGLLGNLTEYNLDPSTADDDYVQLMKQLGVQWIDSYLQENPSADWINPSLRGIKDTLQGVPGTQEPTAAEKFGRVPLGERLKKQFEETRQQLYFRITRDPNLDDEQKKRRLRQAFMQISLAEPSVQEIKDWERLPESRIDEIIQGIKK